MATEYIKFFEGWMDSIETIPDETQRQELALAILRYAFKGEKYQGSSPFVCVMMPTICKAIDATNFFRECGNKGYQKKLSEGVTEGAIQGGMEGVTEGARNNTYTNTYTYTNTNKKVKEKSDTEVSPKKPKIKNDFDVIVYLLDKGVNEDAARTWLKIRQGKKGVNTEYAMNLIDAEVKKAGISWQEAVDCCIFNNWVGFKNQWYQNKQKDNNNGGNFKPGDTRYVSDFKNIKPEDFQF